MSKTISAKPTESELEILNVLWDKKNATVREVHEELSQSKDVGYTTTLKLLQIMYDKGIVSRDDSIRTHIYFPNVSRDKTQKNLMNKFIDTVFSGSSKQLVLQALGTGTTTAEELNEIQTLLNTLKKQKQC